MAKRLPHSQNPTPTEYVMNNELTAPPPMYINQHQCNYQNTSQDQLNYLDSQQMANDTNQQVNRLPTFMNRTIAQNNHHENIQTFLCLINPDYMQHNPELSTQVKTITADVLRATRNKDFIHVEEENKRLQVERESLEMENRELRRKVDDLQTKFLEYLKAPPSIGLTPTASPVTVPVQTSRSKPEDCKVTWWTCPPTNNQAFNRIAPSPPPSGNGESEADDSEATDNTVDEPSFSRGTPTVFAWMQQYNGELITMAQKKKCYKSHRNFWNGRNLATPPQNFSSIGEPELSEYIEYMERSNSWLALCDDHWKTIEVLKKNYYTWKTTHMKRLKNLDVKTAENLKTESKKPRKTKCLPVVDILSSSDNDITSDEHRPSKKQKRVQLTNRALGEPHNRSKGKGKANDIKIVNGKANSTKNVAAINGISIDMAALAKQASSIPSGGADTGTVSVSTPSAASASVQPPVSTATMDPTCRAGAVPPPVPPEIEEFTKKVNTLPDSIPLASENHPLAVYAKDPRKQTEAISDDMLWRTFDGPFTDLIPNGPVEDRKYLVVRGEYGLPGLLGLIRHLAYDRHMDSRVLIPKLERLMEVIDMVTAATANEHIQVQAPDKVSKPKRIVWKVPDIVCPKWLYAHDWKKLPGNETKPKNMFLEHWIEFEKTEKDRHLKYYQKLSHEKNAEAAAAATTRKGKKGEADFRQVSGIGPSGDLVE